MKLMTLQFFHYDYINPMKFYVNLFKNSVHFRLSFLFFIKNKKTKAQSLNSPIWGYFPSSFLTGAGHPNPRLPPHLDT